MPFYKYDSQFEQLTNPPVFAREGPDGSRLKVVMDPWAGGKWSYHQGARGVLDGPALIETEWLLHFDESGDAYPFEAILASGTHGDISPISGEQTHGFAHAIIDYNAQPEAPAKLVNATVRQFCDAIDSESPDGEALPRVRGCFGHTWDLWPVSLAKYAVDMREGERRFLAAEALLATASLAAPARQPHDENYGLDQVRNSPGTAREVRGGRQRAEWLLAMLSDHAWNERDDDNKLHNADLRRRWSQELLELADSLTRDGWEALDLQPDERGVVVFNATNVPKAELVCVELAEDEGAYEALEGGLPSQVVEENGKRLVYGVARLPGMGFAQLRLCNATCEDSDSATGPLEAGPTWVETPFYRLTVDEATGGLGSLVAKHFDTELLTSGTGRSLCQTVYFDGEEHTLSNVTSELVANGPVLARLRIAGEVAGIGVTTYVIAYRQLEGVDFDVGIHKPVATNEQRLCHVFPVVRDGAELRAETTGAVIRPVPQPEGDLLPGADTTRLAVQGFVDASLPDGSGVTIVSLDAFCLRLDLDPLTFEALGNDQNYREVIQNQNGETEFRFRYSLRAHAGPYHGPEAFQWSRAAASPLLVARGALRQAFPNHPTSAGVFVDSERAIATCLKPADDPAEGGVTLRLWETAGQSGPLEVGASAYGRAIQTDLLGRDLDELPVEDGWVTLDLRAHGFAAMRLLP